MNMSYNFINRRLQNLVTSVILRQNEKFGEEDIVNKVLRESVGMYNLTLALVRDYVRNTLEILTIHGVFKNEDGIYTKKTLIV